MLTKKFLIQQEAKYYDFSECPLGLFLYNYKLYVKTGHNSAVGFDGKVLTDASLPVDIHVQACSVFEPFEPLGSMSGRISEDNQTYAETLCEKTTCDVIAGFKKEILECMKEHEAKAVLNYLAMENWSFTSNLVATLCWLVDFKGSLTLWDFAEKLSTFRKELREAYLNVMKKHTF